MPLPSYAVVSPVRDEEENLARTANALVAQTHRPQQWVIVDDGSSDGTREIAEVYAARHDWITVMDSGRPHRRARGAPIVRAFNVGRETLRVRPDFVVKADGDIFFPAHYFAWIAETFARDERAAIAGGVVLVHDGRRWIPDSGRLEATNGVTKAYRSEFLDAIGGLPESMGWDGIDEYAARARGWTVRVLPELTILHYARRGSKQPFYRARWEEGLGNHYMGYLWSFLLGRAAYRMFVESPPVLGGLLLLAGFAYGRIRRLPQIPDGDARAELRREQLARMRRGSRRPEPDALPGGGPAFWSTGSVPPR